MLHIAYKSIKEILYLYYYTDIMIWMDNATETQKIDVRIDG